jgi:CHASE2 domain-containing sensor protein
MKKNLFTDKDVILSTIFVFAFIGLLKLSFVHIPHMDPIYAAFQDYEFSDLVYRHRAETANIDPDGKVVVVEIGDNRDEIANQLRIINTYKPRVVGLDAFFLQPKDQFTDSLLYTAMAATPNLLFGSYLQVKQHKQGQQELVEHVESNSLFTNAAPNSYVNFVGEENKTIRMFSPYMKIEDEEVNSFATGLVKKYSLDKYDQLSARGNKVEYINYRKPQSAYITLSKADIVEGNAALEILKDKIVLIGSTNPNDLSDLHFTPMNERGAGRSKPDMPGVFIHANTIEMILKGDYVNKIPDWVMLVFSVLFTYLTIVLYTYYYVEKHIWFHLVAKLFQFALFFLFLYLEVILLDKANLRFSDKIILVPIVLAVDLLYFYDAFVKWLHNRFGYHTYFLKGH